MVFAFPSPHRRLYAGYLTGEKIFSCRVEQADLEIGYLRHLQLEK